jgi:HD-GYP domain-containing protein (c-di-GMP phosphodiesterase class II)
MVASAGALAHVIDAKDVATHLHSERVGELAEQLAVALGWSSARAGRLRVSALLHDIGKVGIPDSILQKRGLLTEEEWQLMRQHPAIAARILARSPSLSHLAPAVRAEHERWDGGGYPDGLSGASIPMASRIAFACDAYHAMTSDRPYRAAMTKDLALAELTANSGSQFDPTVIDALLRGVDAPPTGEPPLAVKPVDEDAVLHGSGATNGVAPHWHPYTAPGSQGRIGDVRCACEDCGTHVRGVVSSAALGGSCSNCGGYKLAVVD